MRTRKVVFSRGARADLRSLLLFIAGRGGPVTAIGYVERIERFCERLEHFPERGRRLDTGARLIAFEDSATVRVKITKSVVRVVQIAYRGRDIR